VVALFGFYLLQIIDANVFSYMQDFELSDDLTMSVSPTVIAPDNAYASNSGLHHSRPAMSSFGAEGVGLRVGFRF
jgi:hypothetical protein